MGKYDPLRDYLAAKTDHPGKLTMSFDEIEQLVGSLPSSARTRKAWWMDVSGSRTGAQAWRSAGWQVQSVELLKQVVFARNEVATDPGSPPVASLAVRGKGDPPTRAAATRQDTGRQGSHLFRRAMLGDLGIGLIAAAAAGISGIIGLADLPWPMLAFLSAAAGAVGFTMSQAIVSRKTVRAARSWWSASTLILLSLCIGAFVYHESFDPATHSPRTYPFIIDGNESKFIPLYGEAGGPRQLQATGDAGQNGLIGGETYNFDCWVFGLDRAMWLRYERFGQTWWAPRDLLHPPAGESEPPVPHC